MKIFCVFNTNGSKFFPLFKEQGDINAWDWKYLKKKRINIEKSRVKFKDLEKKTFMAVTAASVPTLLTR
jgi:hypothetical protein